MIGLNSDLMNTLSKTSSRSSIFHYPIRWILSSRTWNDKPPLFPRLEWLNRPQEIFQFPCLAFVSARRILFDSFRNPAYYSMIRSASSCMFGLPSRSLVNSLRSQSSHVQSVSLEQWKKLVSHTYWWCPSPWDRYLWIHAGPTLLAKACDVWDR